MTDLQILTAVKNNDGCIEYTALLNQNLTDGYIDPSADKEQINKMIKNGLLEGETRAYCSISITPEGRLFLQDKYYLEEQEQKFADDTARNDAKNKRHDWKIAIVGALIASLSGLAFDIIAFFFF